MTKSAHDEWVAWDGTATVMFDQRYDLRVGEAEIYGAVAAPYDDGDDTYAVFEAADGSELPEAFEMPEFVRPHGPRDTIEAAIGTKH